MTPELLKAAHELGLNTVITLGIFALCVWIVKFFVMRMSSIIDKLAEKLEKHDRNASERGRFVKEEHGRIIDSLKEVQEALVKQNGKRK